MRSNTMVEWVSNGLTSARHDVFNSIYRSKYPESFDPLVPAELSYAGECLLTDKLDNLPVDIGKLILSPTRTYAPIIREILNELRGERYMATGTLQWWCSDQDFAFH